jgi:hypothetical protein
MYAPLKPDNLAEAKNYEDYLESRCPSSPSYSLTFQVFAGRPIGTF